MDHLSLEERLVLESDVPTFNTEIQFKGLLHFLCDNPLKLSFVINIVCIIRLRKHLE